MATDREMAFTIGISPESFSKRKSEQTSWTDDEKIKLTEVYGKAAIPKSAWAPEITIDSQADRLRQKDEELRQKDEEIIAVKNELGQYVRGHKQSWLGALVIFACLFTFLAYTYSTQIIDAVVDKQHGVEILEAKVEYLEMYVGDLEILLDRWAAYDDKREAEKKAAEERYQQLIDGIREAVGE